jgi:2-(1,2-epoxy-1,2-dihydrophenyl)acetyl-CoA isomerase
MESEHALYHKEESIAVITLNRPEVMNATSVSMFQKLGEYLQIAKEDKDVKVVVITGAGKAFCSGGDLKTRKDASAQPLYVRNEDMRWKFNKCMEIRKLPKPVIAAINGSAAGAGCSIALACDIRIASDQARLGLTFVRNGVFPDAGVTYFLPKVVGISKACELIFTGRLIDAHEALRIGLVNMVAPAVDFEKTWKEFARDLATNCAPIPVSLSKIALYQSLEGNLASAMEYEALAQTLVGTTEDAKEGIEAFLNKRKPTYKAK